MEVMEQVECVRQHNSQGQVLNIYNHLVGQEEQDLEGAASLSKFIVNITVLSCFV